MVARRALALSFLDSYAGLLVNLGSSMVIARLLTPSEIGVFSVTMVLVGIVAGLRDMGASAYIIQEKELTDDRIRAAWAVQLGMGLALAILVSVAAVPMASFYRQPEMVSILLVLAFNFAINPFGSITVAWWTREMQFQWIAIMRFSGVLAGAVISISLAYQGYGAISLAWASLATTMVSILVAGLLRPAHLPKLPGLREMRRVFSFGGKMTATSIIGAIAGGAPEAFLGRFQDMAQTGYYSRGLGLVTLFDRLVMSAVNSVTLPLFARKNRAGEPITELYLRAVSLTTGLGWSFLACLAIAAFPVMRILYGDQWDSAVTITRILCLHLAFSLVASFHRSVMVAYGKVDAILRFTIITSIIQVLAGLTGALHGLEAMGWLLSASTLVGCTYALRQLKPLVGFGWQAWRATMSRSLALAGLTALPFALISGFAGFERGLAEWPQLLGATLTCALIFLVASHRLHHPLAEEVDGVLAKIRIWFINSTKR